MKKSQQFFTKLMRINQRFFPFLSFLALMLLFLDLFKYQGFVEKNFKINAYLILNFLFILGLLIASNSIKLGSSLVNKPSHRSKKRNWGLFFEENRFYKYLFDFNLVFFPLILIFTFLIYDIQSQYPAGYIFNILHLHPQGLVHILILSMFLIFIQLLHSFLPNIDKSTL